MFFLGKKTILLNNWSVRKRAKEIENEQQFLE